jgi:hypothetical protein
MHNVKTDRKSNIRTEKFPRVKIKEIGKLTPKV